MIHEDKNIDRLFQEKFKDFDALPDDSVWANIQAKLDEEEDNKVLPLLPWWLQRSVAIAVLLITLGVVTYLNPFGEKNSPQPNGTTVVKSPGKETDGFTNGNGLEQKGSNTNNTPNKPDNKTGITGTDNTAGKKAATKDQFATDDNQTATASFNTAKNVSKKYRFQQNNYSTKYNSENTIKKRDTLPYSGTENGLVAEEKNSKDPAQFANTQKDGSVKNLATNINSSNSSSPIDTLAKLSGQAFADVQPEETIVDSTAIAEATPPQTLDDLIRENNDEEEDDDNEGSGKKWIINPNVAPVYYNSITDGSPISSDFKGNQKSGNINMSYGLNVALQLSKKVTVRSGINNVEFGYSTNGVYFTSSTIQTKGIISSIDYSDSGSAIALANNSQVLSPTFDTSTGLNHVSESSAIVESSQGSLIQNINYIEVPLELKYNVLDKKLGLSVIGGFSTLLLNDNAILLESDGLVTGVGRANNINNVNFSTNVGLGLYYQFAEQLQFNLEPMFKYQLNTFSDSNGFKPYTLGLYTGFSFRF